MLIGPDTLKTPSTSKALARIDAHSWCAKAVSRDVTGPGLTDVNDHRAILILLPEQAKITRGQGVKKPLTPATKSLISCQDHRLSTVDSPAA